MNLLKPGKVEKIMRLFDTGASDRAVARQARVSRKTAARYRRIWRNAAAETMVLRLGPASAAALVAEAHRRNLAPAVLAARIVAGVADEGYFSAVLDE